MVYERIKEVNGRKYRYLVKGFRVGNVVKQKVVKYLGPIDTIYKVGKRHKSNASIYVRELTGKERITLKKSTKSNNAFIRDRARIILLSSEKLFAKQIAEKICCEARKVRNAIKEFNKRGLVVLQRGRSKGAKPKFTENIKRIILMHFSKEPRKFNYHFTAWTLPRFRKHLIDYNVVESMSIETLRQIIIKSGGKLKRSKRWQYSPDKEFHKKNEE